MADMNSKLLAVYRELERKIAAIDVRQGGPMGPSGKTGPTGKTGPSGSAGSQGPVGPKGPAGPKGSKGNKGPTGASGAAGKQGPQGPIGLPGSDGSLGPMGPVGPQGHRGEDGVSIVDLQCDMDGRFTAYLSNGTEIDVGMLHTPEAKTIVYSGGGYGGTSSGGGGGDVPPHNQLDGLQGGDGANFYHLSATDYNTLRDWIVNGIPSDAVNGLDDHINNHNNPHQTTLEDLYDTSVTLAGLRDVLANDGSGWVPDRRVYDRGAYVSGETYYVMDQAMQAGYVGIAKVDTTDPIAPEVVGDLFWPTDGAVATEDFDLLEVSTGNVYTLATTVASNTVRVFVAGDNIGSPHTLIVRVNGVTVRTISWTPTSTGYDQVQTEGSIGFAGDVIELYVTVTNGIGNERVYYEHDDGYWNTYTNPLFSSVTGYYNGATNTNAYGVDAQFQEITASQDWHRISSPSGGGSSFTPTIFTGAGSTGYVSDPLVEQDYFLSDDGTFKAAPVSPIGGGYLNMVFDSNTDTTTEPASGEVRVNAGGDHLAATQLATSNTTSPGNDAGVIWDVVRMGDYVGLWETGGDHEGITYYVTGRNNMGTWTQLEIEAVAGQSATGIDNNRAIQVYFIKNPLNTLPPGGNDGDVLTKVSAADYDTDWETPIVYPTEGENDARYAGLTDFDNHVADVANPHSVTYAQLPDKPTIVTDHGGLGGLGDDDHSQYHTDARGDARYPIRDANFTNMEIVAVMPLTPDANTLYFVVP